MGSLWGPKYESLRKDDEAIVFHNEYEVKQFFEGYAMRQTLDNDEQREFVENLFLGYLHDSDHGISVREIEDYILPEIRKHSYGNPLSEADFYKLKEKLLKA